MNDAHECQDHEARRAISHVRDEFDEREGKMLAEVGGLHSHIDHIRKFLGAPPFVRKGANGTLANLVEEVTGSHNVPSVHPVRASIERWMGKKMIQVMKLAALGVLGWTGHWLWTVLWAAVRK